MVIRQGFPARLPGPGRWPDTDGGEPTPRIAAKRAGLAEDSARMFWQIGRGMVAQVWVQVKQGNGAKRLLVIGAAGRGEGGLQRGVGRRLFDA